MKIPTYSVKLEFTTDVAGGCPQSRNLLSDYIEACRAGTGNVLLAAMREGEDPDNATIEKFLEKATGLHYHDKKGAYIPGVNVIAAMKRAAEALGMYGLTGKFGKALDYGLITPERIYFSLEDSQKAEYVERAVQPIQHGVRNPSIARFEVIPRGAKLEFEMQSVSEAIMPKDQIKHMLQVGGLGKKGGLGGFRSLGFGKFRLVSIKNGKQFSLDSVPGADEELALV
jgi:hypothetical protein